MSAASIRLQREPFDAAAEAAALRRGRTDIGAIVTFTGICRGEENGAPIAALTLEHYPEMAEAEIARQVEAAQARWSLLGLGWLLLASLVHYRHRSRMATMPPGYSSGRTSIFREPHAEHFMRAN